MLKKNLLLIISLIILMIFLYHSQKFKLDASSDTLILQNDEDFNFFKYYNKIFKNNNFLILAIKSDKIIDESYINKIKKLKNELLNINGIDKTFSIVDAPILLSNNISLQDLKNDIETIQNSKINLNIILDEFSKNPLFSNQIINNDKNISSIIIYLDENYEFEEIKNKRDNFYKKNIRDPIELKNINEEYRNLKIINNLKRNNLIKNIREKLEIEKDIDNKMGVKYTYFLGGIDMIVDDTISFVKNDIFVFAITVFIFVFLILYFIFRSIKWVIIPIVSTGYSIIAMIGLIGFLNWEVTAISSNFISLMLILSISMNIHIINNYRMIFNENNHNALKKSLIKMFFPCLYTALTTIVAFGSLLISDIKPVIDFGKIMIFGLIIIFITSFTILPLLISFFPNIKINKSIKFSILNNLFLLSKNHNIKIYLINALLFIISLYGITKLSVENSFVNYFKKNTEIYQGMKLIDQNLGGTTPLDIIVQFNEENMTNSNKIQNNFDVTDNLDLTDDLDLDLDLELDLDLFSEDNNQSWFIDEKIDTIESIHKFLESNKEIGKVQSLFSLINIAEMINKNDLNSFELSVLYNEIPENYKNDLLKPYLSIENNMVKFSTRVKDSENINREKLINNIDQYLNTNYENVKLIKINGLLVLYNNMLQSLFSSQIKSFGFVLVAIFLMFLILFRSFTLSIIGIIPNIFACSFILGFMGIAKIPLDIMTITIAAITIGIAVDNTIHYLYKTKINIRNKMNIKDALKDSHLTVGQAVLTTSITIAFGFSVLCLSNFIPTILFGLFTSIAMIIAMLGVLITLPSGLIRTKI
tara:strand:- start:2000 stop:4447 length:2448 start_codon:yes stop_codon:yes gene_type:complete